MKGIKLVLATFAISLGTFLITLDQFIANVSIPSISGELGASQNNGAWVITSFTVASAIAIPLTGRLTTYFGRVRLFGYSAILFSIFSWFCGLSTSLPMLIFFRVIQGLVSGALIPLSQTLLLIIYPPEKKGLAIGFWGLVIMIGPAMGPVLGGWITASYGWSWIFYINVPTGILAGLMTLALCHHIESKREKIRLDIKTLVLFALAIGSFQVILDKGQDLDWFQSPIIITLTILCLVSAAYFYVLNHFDKEPIIDFSFFKSRNFTLGSIAIGIAVMILFGSLIIYPLWVQAQLGYTPFWAGLTLAPIGVFAAVLFPILGYYLEKVNLKLMIGIAFAIFAATFFYYTNLYSSVPYVAIAFPRLLQGIGFALFYLPLTTIALAGITHDKLPAATSLFSFTRMLFISAGVSLSITFWTRRESFYQSRYVEAVVPSNQALQPYIADVQNLGLSGRPVDAFIMNVVEVEAYTQSLLDLTYLAAWTSVALLGLLFFFRSCKKAAEHSALK